MDNYSKIFKMIIIGDSGVGKTSLLMRYTDDTFKSSFISTIGIDFRIKKIKINEDNIKLYIWDTAGQERFKTITSAYYRGVHAIIYVFDLTNMNSFKNIPNWIDNVNKHADNKNIKNILIGNKSDLPRAISKDFIKEFVKKHNMIYVETSAKDGENVNDAFHTITKELLDDVDNDGKTKDKTNTGRLIEIPVKSKSKCC